MRTPNYKIGWYIPHQVAALTHFHPEVTAEDFAGVVQDGHRLLQDAGQEFHVVIDNRAVAMSAPASLSQMQQMVPYMRHPLLRWVVVVKPIHLALDTGALPVEQAGAAQLKNVASLPDALRFLRQAAGNLQWQHADADFFPDVEQ